MRLLCDEMLKGIGRWLRAAGYDTAIAQDGVADEDLLAQARAENRVLLRLKGACSQSIASRSRNGGQQSTTAPGALRPARARSQVRG